MIKIIAGVATHRTPRNTKPNTRTIDSKGIQRKMPLAFTVLKSMDIWADLQTS